VRVRILLLNPPCRDGHRHVREGRCTHPTSLWGMAWPPYTLALLGGRLGRRGHQVRLIDGAAGDVRFAELRSIVGSYKPDLALLTVAASTFPSDLEAIAQIRAAAPGARVGVLGVYPSALPEECLSGELHPDFVVRGEPELSVEAAVENLELEGEVAPLPGLTVRLGNTVVHGPDRPLVQDVASLGKPDWSLVRTSRYQIPFLRRRFLTVLTSRGCPYQCTFCTQRLYYGRAVRVRSPAAISAEIEELKTRFGIHDFFLWSECFSADREHAHAVCQALKGVSGISWVVTTRADCVDPDLLCAMREAGCWLIGFGFESAVPQILKACRKGHTVADSIQAAQWAREAGLHVLGHFVFGLPGETAHTARATLELALMMDIDFAQFYCVAPYPGTELYELWRKSAAGQRASLSVLSQERACMSTEQLSRREIQRWRRRAVWRFYGRPRTIALLARLGLGGVVGAVGSSSLTY